MSSKIVNRKLAQKTSEDLLNGVDLASVDFSLIYRVSSSRGKNIFECEDSNGGSMLLEMPPKYRNLVWVKRGSLVCASLYDQSGGGSSGGGKILGEITHIFQQNDIKQLSKRNDWPSKFTMRRNLYESNSDSNDDGSDTNMPDYPPSEDEQD